MSNNVIPNFLPPPYDFTTEEDVINKQMLLQTNR